MNMGSKIVAKRGVCKVIIDGNLMIGEGVSFIAEEGAILELIINNQDLNTIMNSVNFVNCNILANKEACISMDECTFTNCGSLKLYGNITINNSQFNETGLFLKEPILSRTKEVRVQNCNINNHQLDGIVVENYPKYFITDNQIKAGSRNGILVYNSGQATNSRSVVARNNVSNSSIGIDIYSSSGSIQMNKIYNNGIGIRLMNISNVSLSGGGDLSSTQQIKENRGIEVYISDSSFPAIFRYNAIIDENNFGIPGDALLYYGTTNATSSRQKDIRYNYWGNNFLPTQDLFPINAFIYNPVWNPGRNSTIEYAAETMYESAMNASEIGNYTQAAATYKTIVADYPETDFAQASLKQLLSLEKENTNDYVALQEYYRGLSDSSLLKVADILANKCNEKMENFADAVAWYENVIANPSCLEDSVFAVIDLRALQLQMNGSKSGDNTLAMQEFETERDYLLSLIPENTTIKQFDDVIH